MLFSDINPYIRYARYLNLNENSHFDKVFALDARLFYALDGYGKIKVNDTEYEMYPYSLIIINSGVPYKLITPENQVSFIAINFDYTRNASFYNIPIKPVSKERFKRDMLVDFNTFEDAPTLDEVFYIRKYDAIQRKLTVIVSEYMKKMLFYESKSGHTLAQCISDCLRFSEIGNTDTKKELAGRILAYIHSNYRENISNLSISELFGYHPNHVSFLVKRITGMPIHQYIIHVRLINASNLLENTTLSCDEIASACGFCDAAYFSRYFKRYFGMSPSKYRNI